MLFQVSKLVCVCYIRSRKGTWSRAMHLTSPTARVGRSWMWVWVGEGPPHRNANAPLAAVSRRTLTHVTPCSREVLVRGFNKSAGQTEGRWGSSLRGCATERKPSGACPSQGARRAWGAAGGRGVCVGEPSGGAGRPGRSVLSTGAGEPGPGPAAAQLGRCIPRVRLRKATGSEGTRCRR